MNKNTGQRHITLKKSGNRVGHNPRQPRLTPRNPIRKGKGGLPRILSLAAERAKSWYAHPEKCKPLCTHHRRQTRSERREAHQIVLEAVLTHLELATMSLGTPTMAGGFVDVSMAKIVQTSGLNQRRCERAIRDLKMAGFMEVKQPRKINAEGNYIGLRAIRVVTSILFEWLGLGPMLERERKRAINRLSRKAAHLNKTIKDLLNRINKNRWSIPLFKPAEPFPDQETEFKRKRWREVWRSYLQAGLDHLEAQKKTNIQLGFPHNWSPGMR